MARGRPKGIPMSEEAKAKLRAYWSAYYADPANKTKTGDACRRAWADPAQHRRRAAILSRALKGKTRSAEIGDKIAAGQIRRWANPIRRRIAVAAVQLCWDSGKLSKRRNIWVPGLYYGEAQASFEAEKFDLDVAMRAINAALPRSLPAAICDDVRQDMLVAMMEGRLPLNRVKAEVKRYVGGNFAMLDIAGRFMSLDAMQDRPDAEGGPREALPAAYSRMEW